jgi:hypothetical protein
METNNPIIIPYMKTVPYTTTVLGKVVKDSYTVQSGEIHIILKDDSYHVEYHNHLYKNTPFTRCCSFSTDFTPHEIARSSEVLTLIRSVIGTH